MAKVRYSFSIENETLEKLRELAKAANRPVSNYLETLIMREALAAESR